MKLKQTQINKCFEIYLKNNPNSFVQFTARLDINSTGRLHSVGAAYHPKYKRVVNCILSKLKGLRFMPPANGPATLAYPFELSPFPSP